MIWSFEQACPSRSSRRLRPLRLQSRKKNKISTRPNAAAAKVSTWVVLAKLSSSEASGVKTFDGLAVVILRVFTAFDGARFRDTETYSISIKCRHCNARCAAVRKCAVGLESSSCKLLARSQGRNIIPNNKYPRRYLGCTIPRNETQGIITLAAIDNEIGLSARKADPCRKWSL